VIVVDSAALVDALSDVADSEDPVQAPGVDA
jgi:hypothetical protein